MRCHCLLVSHEVPLGLAVSRSIPLVLYCLMRRLKRRLKKCPNSVIHTGFEGCPGSPRDARRWALKDTSQQQLGPTGTRTGPFFFTRLSLIPRPSLNFNFLSRYFFPKSENMLTFFARKNILKKYNATGPIRLPG